jgi:hypothetical protein
VRLHQFAQEGPLFRLDSFHFAQEGVPFPLDCIAQGSWEVWCVSFLLG